MGRTWDGGGFWQGPEGKDAGIRSSSLVFGHNVDLVFRVPLQTPQHHVLAAVGQADLWLPILPLFLRTQMWTYFKHGWYIRVIGIIAFIFLSGSNFFKNTIHTYIDLKYT